MAFTQADLDAVNKAIAEVNRRVTVGPVTKEVHELEELLKRKALIERSLLGSGAPSYRLLQTRKGL